MKAPYPYFGGKSTIMSEVWQRLGDPHNFVDPFLGSNAPLLSRPGWDWPAGCWADGKLRIETVNDADCYVANFQRALKHDPEAVAAWADDPVNEADLHARHTWLVNNEDFVNRMHGDPDYYDVKVAGWWVWGICQWIGSGWCKRPEWQKRPHLGGGMGLFRTSQKIPHLWSQGRGIHQKTLSADSLQAYFAALSARLRRVRVCCGDWFRVLGPTPTTHNGLTAVILDPPYGEKANRTEGIYAKDSFRVAARVRHWAIKNGNHPKLRIALFGYYDEHDGEIPADWERLRWSTRGGMANRSPNGQGVINKHKECIWFSPHCLNANEQKQLSLFKEALP